MSNPTIAPLATARRRDLLTPMEDNSAPQVRVKRVKFVSMLPVRYALGINESDPPEVSDRFKVTDSDGQAMPKKGSVRYTLRRLRAGYLHIYSERDQDWFCFLAHPNGGALQLLRAPMKYVKRKPENATQGSLAAVAAKENRDNACAQPSPLKTSATGMLLLPEDYPIWLAFSDVMWTEKILSDFKGEELRKKHMRKFDPKDWQSSWGNQDHISPLNDAPQRVADLKGQVQSDRFVNTLKREAFWFSRDPFLRMSMDALNCMEVSPKTVVDPRIMERGAIVALEDPSGITMDLAALMIKRYEAFLDAKDPVRHDHPLRRRMQVAAAITMIGNSVKTKGEYDGLASQEANKATAKQVAREVADHARQAGLGASTATSYRTSIEADYADTTIAMRVENSRERAWDKYKDLYDGDAIDAWQKSLKTYTDKFNNQTLTPLMDTYQAWIKSQRMQDYCQTHYDVYAPESGLVYTRMIERCIGGIQDKGACIDLIQEWLKGSVDDKHNLVLRALVMNQDKLAQAVTQAVQGDSGITWKSLIPTFISEYQQVVERKHEDVLIRFLSQIMGSVVTVLKETNKPTLIALAGAISRKPIVRLDLKGTKEAFLRALLSTSFKYAEPASGDMRIHNLVNNEVDLLKIKGEPLNTEITISCLLPVDPAGVHGIPAGMSVDEQVNWFKANIHSPEQFQALPVWKNALSWSRMTFQEHAPAIFGVVTLMLNYSNMNAASDALKKSMTHKVEENRWRYYLSVSAVAGAIVGAIGITTKYAASWLGMGEGISRLAAVRGAELLGESVAGLTGLIAAGLDFNLT